MKRDADINVRQEEAAKRREQEEEQFKLEECRIAVAEANEKTTEDLVKPLLAYDVSGSRDT